MTTDNKEKESNSPINKIREEFGDYLRANWGNRESLDVSSWWLNRFQEELNLIEEEVEEVKRKVSQSQGTYKYDDCYNDCLNIIHQHKESLLKAKDNK